MKPAKDGINSVLKKLFLKKHPLLGEIIVGWEKIAGERLSSISFPIKISSVKYRGKNCDILYVKARNSSIALEISFQKEILIERIALYLGYKAVNDLRAVNTNS